ncbi:hypothetical protein [Halobacillus naozhouensis]|uniref:Uncharacterized protein n=1 Tax=Halobacillus naozhouensis TaxID=554880 RepID=A0ABY8J010_9BACI|nr:hypothetical protein [Halobacillus naozhouensis]WFT75838.1 hypothetical protein P9989_05500 [Halobacillus naozhouensis]
MRVFLITWSVALATGALTFFYQTKILTSPPVSLGEAVIFCAGTLVAAVFFIWAMKESPKKYTIVISWAAIFFFMCALLLAVLNQGVMRNNEWALVIMDVASVIASGAVAVYGGNYTLNKRKERSRSSEG